MRKPKNLIAVLTVIMFAAVITAVATTHDYEGTATGTIIINGKVLKPMAEWEGTWNDGTGVFSGTWADPDFNNGAGITGTFTGSVSSSVFTGTWSADNVDPDPIGDLLGYVDADTAYGTGDADYLENPPPSWGSWWSTSSD
ncbi:hypothetical protein GF359_01245 [candidate division WOR-3 bacterium]|uniref:Uncharacterized protein n=1 Tax=candidate division WOR-3 bacterium TaxID=2052148 RepID=A0A9D5K8Z6_UNCW3|nr:hypothetical protein [candidate division WOR-3 bacterium]MBD3363820.1 hypothetical protein [candidate division WOR-3 bacterium]